MHKLIENILQPVATNDNVQQNVTGATDSSNLQEAQSKTLHVSHSNVPTIQAPHSQISQVLEHDYAEIATQNNQIQTAQIGNLSQLETITLSIPEEQQSTNVTRENVTIVTLPGLFNKGNHI